MAFEPNAVQPKPLNTDLAFQGLTVQMEAYCVARMGGMNPPDAYASAYKCEDWERTSVYRKAFDLERHGKVVSRLRQMIADRDSQTSLVPRVTRAFVLEGVAQLALHAEKETTRLRAFEMLGKSVGIDLFRETVVTERKQRTVEEVDQELKDALARLQPTVDGVARRVDASDSAPLNTHQVDSVAYERVNPDLVKSDRRRKPKA